MKKSILSTILCAAAVATASAADHNLTVKLDGLGTDTVVFSVIRPDMRGIEKRDTLVNAKHKYVYDIQGDKARFVQLTSRGSKGQQVMLNLYAVPGECGKLTGNVDNAVWSGTKFYKELATLEKTTDPLQKELDKVLLDYQMKMAAGANRDSLLSIINPIYEEKSKALQEAREAYVKANPASEVSLTILNRLPNLEENLAKLPAELRTGRFSDFVNVMQETVDRQKEKAKAQERVKAGKEAPNFTLKTPEGTDLSLSDLRGKYVVLDFWGSWCVWCIKGVPEMKKYYEKYAGKLEILGVDCNDTEAKWKEAIQKHELPWKHVYNTKDSKVLEQYAIEGFPTKIIIDPEGRIVKTVVGESPEFYEFLDNLFK